MLTFTTGPFETNCYLLSDEGVLIDAPPGSAPLIEEQNVPIHTLLLTHSHLDHIGDVAYLQKKFSLKVYVHEADSENLKYPGADKLPLFFPVEGASPDGFLEGQIAGFSVIHTPGHSPGSVCFYRPGLLFSGDTLFKGSIGNLSLPTAEPDRMWPSLQKLSLLPKETLIYPGHGEPTTIGEQAWLANAKEMFLQ